MIKLTGARCLFLLASIVYAGYPTHPNQTGLKALGIDRTTLPVSSQLKFTSEDNGKVITDLHFKGKVLLNGTDGITFKRCWFTGDRYYGIYQGASPPYNTTLEDCDFGGYGENAWVGAAHVAGLQGTNYLRRCNFYNAGDCIKLSRGSTNYIENCWVQPVHVGAKHTDCMQMNDEVAAKVYAKECTFELRNWGFDGATAHSHEEITQTVAYANARFCGGNSVLQTNITGLNPAAYISFKGCLIAGGNYITTASGQNGEFIGNTVVRGSACQNTDLGLRDRYNLTIADNIFHDNGAAYSGGKIVAGYTYQPVPKLTFYSTGMEDAPDRAGMVRRTGPGVIRVSRLRDLAAANGWLVFDAAGRQQMDPYPGTAFIVTAAGADPVRAVVMD